MAWSGGNYTKGNNATGGWTGDASLGIGIEAGRHDTQDDDFATGINQCLNKDGSNAATGNLNLGGNKLTNIGAATARTDAAQTAQVQDSSPLWGGTSGGTSTAYTITLSPAITAYATGQTFRWIANATVTGAATINVNSVGAKTLQRQGTALVGNEFKTGDIVEMVYDGTQFQITNIASAPIYVDRTNNRVGIGTTTPTYDLEVANTATRCQITRFSADINGSQVDLAKSRGATVGTNTIVQSGDFLGVLRFAGANGTNFTEAGYIACWVDGTPGATNDMPGRITFATTSDGSGTATERMRITSSGYVGIGGTPVAKLHTFGTLDDDTLYVETAANRPTIRFLKSGTSKAIIQTDGGGFISGSADALLCRAGASGGVYLTQTGTSWAAISDIRFKKNVKSLEYGLPEILAMRPVRFDYVEDDSEGSSRIGLIAQELKPVVPEAVQGNEEIRLGIAITDTVPVLIKAIQELNAKVESLEARIAALEA